MSEETQTTPESVQEGGKGGLNARNGLPTLPRPASGVPAARAFQSGDRVRVDKDATWGLGFPSHLAGQTATVRNRADRDGDYFLESDDNDSYAHGRFLTLIDPDQSPDLQVIAYEDIKPGMVVEKRERFAIRADGLWGGYLPEFRLVSAPEPDPDAELAEQVASLMSVSIEMGHSDVEVARDLIALVDEHRAGSDE